MNDGFSLPLFENPTENENNADGRNYKLQQQQQQQPKKSCCE